MNIFKVKTGYQKMIVVEYCVEPREISYFAELASNHQQTQAKLHLPSDFPISPSSDLPILNPSKAIFVVCFVWDNLDCSRTSMNNTRIVVIMRWSRFSVRLVCFLVVKDRVCIFVHQLHDVAIFVHQ